jgi:hypothetical protein
MIIDVLQIVVPKDRLRTMPKEERTLFLMLGYAADQIIVGVALPSFAGAPDDPLPSTSVPQNGSPDRRGPLWFWLEGF